MFKYAVNLIYLQLMIFIYVVFKIKTLNSVILVCFFKNPYPVSVIKEVDCYDTTF